MVQSEPLKVFIEKRGVDDGVQRNSAGRDSIDAAGEFIDFITLDLTIFELC
jgi:hypothetical protein